MFKNIPKLELKTTLEIAYIRKSCRIVEKTLKHLKNFIKPGITTRELDYRAERYLAQLGVESALKGYEGFPASICTSVNHIAAHGIPDNRPLEDGDILSVDLTVAVNGWHGDGAWTFAVGAPTVEGKHLIRTAYNACMAGIKAVKTGGHIGDLGFIIGKSIKKSGCRVLKDFVGHGIGKKIHEDPVIPHFGMKGMGYPIVPGMVFTVEPIVTNGKGKAGEGMWNISTRDKAPAAQFEHTLAVFKDSIEILTISEKIFDRPIDQILDI